MTTRPARSVAALVLSFWLGAPVLADPSLHLDGSGDWVRVAHAPTLNTTGAITIEAWVHPTTTVGCRTIVGKNWQSGYWLGLCGGRVRFWNAATWRDGTAIVPANEWTHVAVAFDGTTRRYYVNGILDLEASTPGPVGATLANLGIGAEDTGVPYEFAGNLSLVRIWSVSRTQHEIRRDLIRPMDLLVPEPELVGQWMLTGNARDSGPGDHDGVPVGNAFFDPTDSPSIDHDPIPIALLAPDPTLDGECSPGEYVGLRLPVWMEIGTVQRLGWIDLVATATHIWVCAKQLEFDPGAAWSSLRIRLNPSPDPATPSYEFWAQENGGWGSSPFWIFSLVSGVVDLDHEFHWGAELRIARTALASPDSEFRMLASYELESTPSTTSRYPIDAVPTQTSTWETYLVGATLAAIPDADPPTVTVQHTPDEVKAGDTVQVSADAQDDVDVERIDLYLDRSTEPAATCFVPQSHNTSASCSTPWTSVAPGLHTYSARVTDRRGRVGVSNLGSFRAVADGTAPVMSFDLGPLNPDGTITFRVDATDDTGVSRILLSADASGGLSQCDFSPPHTSESCSLTVSTAGRRWISFGATTTDVEGFASHGTRVWADSAGLDPDDDGITDEVERYLCTRADDADSDGDGLVDGWEVFGLQLAGGGFVDLPAMGADPCHKDVFLQYDYEAGARVEPGVVEAVVAAFRRGGITLHVTENDRPAPPPNTASALGAGDATYQLDAEGRYWFDPKLNWTHRYLFSRHYAGRSSSVPYSTFDIYLGDACACPQAVPPPAACPDGYGAAPACGRENADDQARRFMHELGHQIGLGHGGRASFNRTPVRVGPYLYYQTAWDSRNFKPNYPSVMNYGTNGGLVCALPPDPNDTSEQPRIVSELTYSSTDLGYLDELELYESPTSYFATAVRAQPCTRAAEGAVPAFQYTCFDPNEPGLGDDAYLRYYMLSDGRQTLARMAQLTNNWQTRNLPAHPDGIDWTCDGAIGSGVGGSINGEGYQYILPWEICDGEGDDTGCAWESGQRLTGQDDWSGIPNPPECIQPYFGDRQCYMQPLAYRAQMGPDAPDCRDWLWLDRDCTSSSPLASRDLQAAASSACGPAGDWAPRLPGLEFCNDRDDDGDGDIDEGCRDTDADGSSDGIDNCLETPNADQADRDGDFVGDACARPGPVTGLFVRVTGTGTSRTVAWTGSPADVSGFHVYREDPGDPNLRFLAALDPGVTGFGDVLTAAGRYVYHVRALNPAGVEGDDASVETISEIDEGHLVVEPLGDTLVSMPRGAAVFGAKYLLSNPGSTPIDFTVTEGIDWLFLYEASGTLAPGAMQYAGFQAESLVDGYAPGSYSGTLTYTNTTNGRGNTTRNVGLKILGPCEDGIDNDGDGLVDWPADPACQTAAFTRENAKCQDGVNNDAATGIDFDGGASVNGGVPLDVADPQCVGKPWRNRETVSSCGLGAELALLLGWLAQRRRHGARARSGR